MLPFVLLLAVAQAPAPQRVTLVFGGDVIPHEPLKDVAKARAREADGGVSGHDGWASMLDGLAPALERSDFAIVNLEAPIVTLARPETGGWLFSGPPALLGALKAAGVDVATFANNHCLDQHREGIVSTREHLEAAGLRSAGADLDAARAWAPLVLEKNGLRVGVLAVTRFLNGFNNKKDEALPHVPAVPYDDTPIGGGRSVEAFLAHVRAQAQAVDALVVFIHWGAEYKPAPAPEDRRLAQQLLDAGAFAVIGHHPHVLQPVEYLARADGTRGLVAFSLGNLLSNQDPGDPRSPKRDGLLLELELVRDAPGEPVRLERATGVPLVTAHRGRGRARSVKVVRVEAELAELDTRLLELAARTDKAAKAERRRLEAERRVLLERSARIASFLVGTASPTAAAGK